MRNPRLTALMAGALLWGFALPGHSADEQDAAKTIAAGGALLTTQCAACHAVGKTGASPRSDAPPFRTLHRKYPLGHLAEALAEGITTGHNDMPEFIFSTDEITAILAYLDSIADTPPPEK